MQVEGYLRLYWTAAHTSFIYYIEIQGAAARKRTASQDAEFSSENGSGLYIMSSYKLTITLLHQHGEFPRPSLHCIGRREIL